MARVTVEDCVLKVPNRFELVMLASQRARNISAGARETVERDNDKNPVVALREIADETVVLDELRETLVQSLQKHLPFDDPEQEEEPVLAVIGDAALVTAAMASDAAAAAEDATKADDDDADVSPEEEVPDLPDDEES